ncbi:unnamed protein product [Microthlaspi erraticum]|uniref:Transmembrane protein n=1 Tax=Microthlaspi erraticum TaxID=1685480 RepID=A0A6D2KCT7_9BRAS|nr:unnamed protein product [Microthlaspi erraticum]CAA7050062.1 unnamed protein product [Microthlaspi erraticum]
MANERSSSIIFLSVLVLALVLSPILPCQAARELLGGEMRMMPELLCPACVCCAPAPPGACCPCQCT